MQSRRDVARARGPVPIFGVARRRAAFAKREMQFARSPGNYTGGRRVTIDLIKEPTGSHARTSIRFIVSAYTRPRTHTHLRVCLCYMPRIYNVVYRRDESAARWYIGVIYFWAIGCRLGWWEIGFSAIPQSYSSIGCHPKYSKFIYI